MRMGKQTFLIISLLAVLAVAALGAFLISGRGGDRPLRPGVDRPQTLVESGSVER
jgi:hypothetical protein